MSSSTEEKRVLITALRRASAAENGLSNTRVRAAGQMLDISERHVRRLVAHGVGSGQQAFDPTDDHISILFSVNGNATKAARLIREHSQLQITERTKRQPTERTIRRALRERVDPVLVKAASQGFAGVRSAHSCGVKYAPHKGHTYATDSTPFDLLVRDDVTGEVIDLHQTHVIDEATRFVLVVNTTNGAPDTSVSIAVLAAAVTGYETDDGIWVGGMPDRVLSDNGPEYKSNAVANGLVRIGFEKIVATPEDDLDDVDNGEIIHDPTTGEIVGTVRHDLTIPGQPWKNGISERFHKTLHEDFCNGKPGYVSRRLSNFERLDRRQYWRDRPKQLLTRRQFEALLHAWLMKYNFERPHGGLNGHTPIAAWTADPHVIERPDPEAVRLAMLVEGTATVDKGSFGAFGTRYYSPDLGPWHGRTVEVRFLPGRLEEVTVFHNGTCIGTATRREDMTADINAQMAQVRDKQTASVRAHSAAGEQFAATLVRKELVALGEAEDDLPEIPATPKTVSHRDPKSRRSARDPHVTKEALDDVRNLIPTYVPNPEEDFLV